MKTSTIIAIGVSSLLAAAATVWAGSQDRSGNDPSNNTTSYEQRVPDNTWQDGWRDDYLSSGRDTYRWGWEGDHRNGWGCNHRNGWGGDHRTGFGRPWGRLNSREFDQGYQGNHGCCS